MDLLWPGLLILLVLVPLIIAAYVFVLRRRKKFVVRYSSLSLVMDALPKYSRLRRYLPVALFIAGLGSLLFALTRPVSIVSVPTSQRTIILAMDVSRSMCSTDIEPSRFEAAQAAALSFIQAQQADTEIGLVAFAGFAEVIQPPTSDKAVLADAIASLTVGRRTAIGSSILKSIDAIAEIDPKVAPSVMNDSMIAPEPVPNGAYAPSIIVVLTDGASNAGPEPVDAAQQAADRGLRVFTIGFGTERGVEVMTCSAKLLGGEPQIPMGGGGGGGGGNFGGGRFRRGIDEETLKQVASMTGAEYYSAESTDQLISAFQNLPTNLIVKHETTEISFAFVALGALLAVVAITLSLLWHALP